MIISYYKIDDKFCITITLSYTTMWTLAFMKLLAAFGVATNGLYGPRLSDSDRAIYSAMATHLAVIDTLCEEEHNYEWSDITNGDWTSDSDIPKDLRSLFFAKTRLQYLEEALMCAVIINDIQMVKWLVALGANGSPFDEDDVILDEFDFDDEFEPYTREPYITATSMAVRLGHHDILEILLQNSGDDGIEYVVYVAILKNCIRSLEMIYDYYDVDVDMEINELMGATPLIIAAKNAKSECVTFFIDHGASKDAVDWEGHTALKVAEEKCPVCFEILMDYVPNVALPVSEAGDDSDTGPATGPATGPVCNSSSSDEED